MSDKKASSKSIFSKYLTVGNLIKIPAAVGTLRGLWDAVNWSAAETDVRNELRQKIAIVGAPNSGKSTLFNTLQGKYRSPVSEKSGSTTDSVVTSFGMFTLVDTPGHKKQIQLDEVKQAVAALFVLDGSHPITETEIELFAALQDIGKPVIIALNKCDLPAYSEELRQSAVAALNMRHIIAVSALRGDHVLDDLIPAIIEISPDAALLIGKAAPVYRSDAAKRIIRNSALITLTAGLEPIPLVDIPIILSAQIRMVLRIAALFGDPISSENAKELITAIAGSLLIRYLAEETAKAAPFGGDLISGAMAAAGTWSIGMAALAYFENDKKLQTSQLQALYKNLLASFRSLQNPKEAIDRLSK